MSNSDRISQCEWSLSTDFKESGESYDFIDDNTDETNVSDSHGILLSSLNKNRNIENELGNNTLLRCINTTLVNMVKSTESPALKIYTGAYGSCKFYKVDNRTRIVPISYPHLYWYRGVELENLNRIEYFSTIQNQKDQPDTNDEESPHTQYKSGQKKSKTYKFDKTIEI